MRNGFLWIDERVADAADAALDSFWSRLGISRSQVARGLIIASTTLDFYYDLPHRNWAGMSLSALVFVLCYHRVSHGYKTPFDQVSRIVGLFLALASLLSMTSIPSRSWEPGVSLLLFVAYLYAIHRRDGGPRKRRHRRSLSEVKKLFGTAWMPKPQEAWHGM